MWRATLIKMQGRSVLHTKKKKRCVKYYNAWKMKDAENY